MPVLGSPSTTTGLYLPNGWGASIRPKLAAAGSALARVTILADSIGFGYDATSPANSWAGRVTANLQAAHGDGGSGIIPNAACTKYDPYLTRVYTTAPVTMGTPADWATNELGPSSQRAAGDGMSTVTYYTTVNGATITYAVRGTSVTVFYGVKATGQAAGTFTVKIDGSVVDTVNTATEQVATQSQRSRTYTTTAGAHTVTFTSTGTNEVQVHGAGACNTTGVVVDNISRSGVQTDAYVYANGQGVPVDAIFASTRPTDLLICALGLNDDGAGSSPVETFAKNIKGIVQAAKDNTGLDGSCDVLFLQNHVGYFGRSTRLYGAYSAALRGIAAGIGAAVVDMWGLYGGSYNKAITAGFFSTRGSQLTPGPGAADMVHPSDAGHAVIANAILPLLS